MSDSVSQTATDEQNAANRARFELELEFVQSLANPFYLQSLAQQNILEQPAFINFLEYLMYWKEKDYARFIQYVLPLLSWCNCYSILRASVIHMPFITWSSCRMLVFDLR
jgi:hypothetical protein